MKEMPIICIILLVMISAIALSSCRLLFQGEPYGEADRTIEFEDNVGNRSSNENNLINTIIERGTNWEQVVVESRFQLDDFIYQETKANNGMRVYRASYGTYPCIEGSTVCIPMGTEFARQHLNMEDLQARDMADFGTTPVAYNRLINKENSGHRLFYANNNSEWPFDEYNIGYKPVDLILVTEPSDDELSRASEVGVELVVNPICWDAFVFITHKDNPVDSLTVEQIRDIYSGNIKNWNEVGGQDQKIVAYQREQNSGSQTTMEKQVMNGLPMIPAPMAKIAEDMGALVDVVSEYVNEEYSIGYTFKYYIDNLYRNEDIKIIAINGIIPTDDNIRDGSYPFTTNYYAVYRSEDENGIAGQFTEWILSDEGQRCIEQAGYIPLR